MIQINMELNNIEFNAAQQRILEFQQLIEVQQQQILQRQQLIQEPYIEIQQIQQFVAEKQQIQKQQKLFQQILDFQTLELYIQPLLSFRQHLILQLQQLSLQIKPLEQQQCPQRTQEQYIQFKEYLEQRILKHTQLIENIIPKQTMQLMQELQTQIQNQLIMS